MTATKSTRAHNINCIARWMVDDFPTESARHAALDRIEAQHGKVLSDDVRHRVAVILTEWMEVEMGGI